MKHYLLTGGLFLVPALALAQEAGETSLPVLDILAMGGWITWPIYGLLLVGIAFSLSRFLQIRMDSGRDQALRTFNPVGKSLQDMRRQLDGMQPGSMTQTARDMLAQFEHGRRAGDIQSRIEHHVNVRQESFKPYTNWMQFLSESAGALGLLGTVLGMFQTFFGGTLDKDKILHGMGVALITTLVGIIVSLLLNLALTVLRNHFDRVVDAQYAKLMDIRQAMLEEIARQKD